MNDVQLPKIEDDDARRKAISILLRNEQPYVVFTINENDNLDIYTNNETMLEEVEDWAYGEGAYAPEE